MGDGRTLSWDHPLPPSWVNVRGTYFFQSIEYQNRPVRPTIHQYSIVFRIYTFSLFLDTAISARLRTDINKECFCFTKTTTKQKYYDKFRQKRQMIVGIKTIASESSISQMYASTTFFCIIHFFSYLLMLELLYKNLEEYATAMVSYNSIGCSSRIS